MTKRKTLLNQFILGLAKQALIVALLELIKALLGA